MNRPTFPKAGPADEVYLVERSPSDTQPQGTATVRWTVGGAQGTVSPLVQVGRWSVGKRNSLARTVRVVGYPVTPPVPPANFNVPPLPGAMALITYQGQNGLQIKRWVPYPFDLELTATQVFVQACAVGLPYQAFPGNCQLNTTGAVVSFQVGVTFMEESGDLFPSTPLYPASFNNGAVNVGASLGGGAASTNQPLVYTQSATGFSNAGFLRSIQITNSSTATVYICLVDAPAVLAGGLSAAQAIAWASTVPIAVPSGNTVLRAFDDLPFFWGPWVAAVASLPSGALVDGTSIFIEGDYAPIVAPGY